MKLNGTEELIQAAKNEAKKMDTPLENVLLAYQINVLAIIAKTIFLNGVSQIERRCDGQNS